MELVLSGSTEHLLNGLLHSDFAHVRIPGYDGVDSIQVSAELFIHNVLCFFSRVAFMRAVHHTFATQQR